MTIEEIAKLAAQQIFEEFGLSYIGLSKHSVDRMSKIIEEKIREQKAIDDEFCKSGEASDGYHTFNELYDFRREYNAALVNSGIWKAHKSYRHHDGELCFGGGWFIVMIETPLGKFQIIMRTNIGMNFIARRKNLQMNGMDTPKRCDCKINEM